MRKVGEIRPSSLIERTRLLAIHTTGEEHDMSHARPIATLLAAAVLTAVLLPAAAAGSAPAELRVIESSSDRIVVEALFPEPAVTSTVLDGRTYDLVSIPGTHPLGEPGSPTVAVAATLLSIPGDAGPRLTILESDVSELHDLELAPVQLPGEERTPPDESVYGSDAYAPSSFAAIGDPAIMRDLRVVPLRIYPIAYSPAKGSARVLSRIVVEIDLSAPGETNILDRSGPISAAFAGIYEDQVLNFDRSRYESDERGKYLIITHDTFYSTIQEFAEWKHLRGREVEVAKLSVIGSSASAIKSYIQDAYDTWAVPPDYILLVGDTEYVPLGSGYTDDYYATLAGSDYVVDVHLGRFSADSVSDCELLVAKTLGYRRTPFMSDPNWFKSACLVVRDDYDSSDATYYDDTWHAYDLMESAGFAVIDTLFRKHGADGDDWVASINAGRTLVNYRGQGVSNWWSPFDIYPSQTTNGYKLPVIMSATCGTGSFSSDGYPCETWMRAGTVANPKGSVAFVATGEIVTGGAHLRSVVNQYYHSELFQPEPGTVAECLNQGKYRVYALYGDQDEYEGWNCQGDPELSIWTDTPRMLDVTHDATVPTGVSSFNVLVEHDGSPIRNAAVCVYAEGEAYDAALTGASGEVSFTLDLASADTLRVTVTGDNMHPYEGSAVVTLSGPYLVYDSHLVDDSAGGNGDGLVSPGETIDLTLTLQNAGPDDATGVSGVLDDGEGHVTLVDSAAMYGTIVSGGTGSNLDALSFSVNNAAPDGAELGLELLASDGTRASWLIPVEGLTVSAANLARTSTTIDDAAPGGDGDGLLEPGETAWVTFDLVNDGALGLLGVTGTLSTSDPFVAVTDGSGFFGNMPSGASATNTNDRFRVSISGSVSAPEDYSAALVLDLAGTAPTYTHQQALNVPLSLEGNVTTGPDAYGYYAYDAGDVWSGHAPVYDWVEIVPPGPGAIVSEITNEDAQTTTVSLPFTFQYYGTDYTTVSICSNGFLALGNQTYRFGDNSQIPDTHGPAAMVAPFWDDLDPSDGGDIYQWYDSANHRFVVQFDENVHYGGGNPETFQVILYDPAYYPTATGDGEIVFQYEDVRYPWSMTAGIENPTQSAGIQYLYNSTYGPAAAEIVNGQAIKFTTEPPSAPAVWLVADGLTVDDSSGGDGDSTAEPLETVDLILDIENLGTETASSVTGVITTSDPDVTIDDGTATFGSIGSGATVSNSASPFVLTVAAEPDSDVVELDLHLSTGTRYDAYDVVTLTLDLTGTGIDGLGPRFALYQNAPNPFSAGTRIAFNLPVATDAELAVYNVAGRRVATLHDGPMTAGPHAVEWNGRDDSGRPVSSGIYFYRLTAGEREDARKMIYLK
ncbi:MAG: T9SS type A sorting domain-containing protein [Candidatus Eisenbacteria bacterium]|nr:T9SS type A sorting domain-containing protein [Candidatus Eisenbacteria bacterium]